LYHSETLELMLQRWSKLERDFRMKNGRYDISKIPDIYDCIKYDSQHNASVGLEDTLELFRLSRALADIVFSGGDVSWSSCSNTTLLYKREPRSLPA
ncbi:Inositol hexakisphosphate and diphosphoinositol-pentakisphosphate kinase 1, partial [Goodea atripinnis]